MPRTPSLLVITTRLVSRPSKPHFAYQAIKVVANSFASLVFTSFSSVFSLPRHIYLEQSSHFLPARSHEWRKRHSQSCQLLCQFVLFKSLPRSKRSTCSPANRIQPPTVSSAPCCTAVPQGTSSSRNYPIVLLFVYVLYPKHPHNTLHAIGFWGIFNN